MTQSIKNYGAEGLEQGKNISRSEEDDIPSEYEEYFNESSEDFGLEGEESFFTSGSDGVLEGGATADRLRARLYSLESSLDWGKLSLKDKAKILEQVESYRQRINYFQSLAPEVRDAQLVGLQGEIARLEGNVATGRYAPAESEELSEDEVDLTKDPAALKDKIKDLREKIDSLKAKAWVTEEYSAALLEKLGRYEMLAGDSDMLETVAAGVEGIESEINEAQLAYIDTGKPADSIAGEGAEVVNGSLDALTALAGVNEQQVLMVFKQTFPQQSIKDIDALKKAIKNEEAPFTSPPTKAVIEFLKNLDAQFGQKLASANQWHRHVLGPAYRDASSRLSSLLQALYGDEHLIFPAQADTSGDYLDWKNLNDISFDGEVFSYSKEEEGLTNQLAWDSVASLQAK
ncbi:MAG: hypothetical protein IT572_00655 [Deltaproteobacteria bacterium]|nr:hypothetical protein [Deltaproteobacteria bacterium]